MPRHMGLSRHCYMLRLLDSPLLRKASRVLARVLSSSSFQGCFRGAGVFVMGGNF